MDGVILGCMAKTVAKPYRLSLESLLRLLRIDARLLEDHPCCGGFLAEDIDVDLAETLGKILGDWISEEGIDRVYSICPHCLANLRLAGLDARHALELLEDILDDLRDLSSLEDGSIRAALYPGCRLEEDLRELSRSLLESIGVEVVDLDARDLCCGGRLAVRNPVLAERMAESILKEARGKADLIATPCGLCFHILDFFQKRRNYPVLTIPEVLGLSLGLGWRETGLRIRVSGLNALSKLLKRIFGGRI